MASMQTITWTYPVEFGIVEATKRRAAARRRGEGRRPQISAIKEN
jgi:hypothetical protein